MLLLLPLGHNGRLEHDFNGTLLYSDITNRAHQYTFSSFHHNQQEGNWAKLDFQLSGHSWELGGHCFLKYVKFLLSICSSFKLSVLFIYLFIRRKQNGTFVDRWRGATWINKLWKNINFTYFMTEHMKVFFWGFKEDLIYLFQNNFFI